jgi:plasmid stabilization system protein ParE
MKYFQITVSIESKKDIADLKRYIKDELKAPETASHYIEGLDAVIQKLSFLADSIGKNKFVQNMFGINAKHILYKKMAIIFYREDDCVYIRCVIASSMIH